MTAHKPCLPPPWHISYMCTAMPRLPFCMILTISRSLPEVSPFQFLSLSSSNLSTTELHKARLMASLASQTLVVSTAFEASKQTRVYDWWVHVRVIMHRWYHMVRHTPSFTVLQLCVRYDSSVGLNAPTCTNACAYDAMRCGVL